MNQFAPHLNVMHPALNPPAIVQAAFDEERALAEVRQAIERRDEAKGEYKDAILAIGQVLIDARRAMPGVMVGGSEKYSPQFLAFVEKCGLGKMTAAHYMGFVRDPKRLELLRQKAALDRRRGGPTVRVRRKTLKEVLDMLKDADSVEQAMEVIRGELNEQAA
jgi:hypothetical protein